MEDRAVAQGPQGTPRDQRPAGLGGWDGGVSSKGDLLLE